MVTGTDTRDGPDLGWRWQGQELAVGAEVRGDGPCVLLLPAPSSISTRAEMRPLATLLARRMRVVTVDWPGFGEAPKPRQRWTPDAFSDFLDAVVTALRPAPEMIVAAGHAAAYVLHHVAIDGPASLRQLVLVAPTWRGPLPTMAGGDRAIFRRLRRTIEAPLIGPALYRLNVNRAMVRMMSREHVYSDMGRVPAELLEAQRRVTATPGARFGTAAFVTGGLDRVTSRAAFLDLARRAGLPMLLIEGGETPRKSAAEMAALGSIPGVTRRRLDRGKLAPHVEFPEEIAGMIATFLTRTA